MRRREPARVLGPYKEDALWRIIEIDARGRRKSYTAASRQAATRLMASRAAVRIVQTRTDAPDASDLFSEVPKDDLIPGIDLGDGATATGAAGNQSLLHAYRAILRSVLSAAQRRAIADIQREERARRCPR